MTQITQAEEHHEELKTFIEKFEEKFGVTVDSTGYENTAKENGGLHEEEYFVDGVIKSGVEGLDFSVGGWFCMDTRGDGKPAVYCTLSVTMNGQKLGGDAQMLKCRYHHDEEDWGELRWDYI